MFKELFTESKLIYVVDFKTKLTRPEIADLSRAVPGFKNMLDGTEIETTDKKIYNKILDKADEIGLKYDNFVETIK